MSIRIFSTAVTCGLLVTTFEVRANYIREEGGTLTTDLPGVSIAPLSSGGLEAWTITADLTVWSQVVVPSSLAEPASEPGLVNRFVAVSSPVGTVAATWTSDAPGTPTPFPNGSTFDWITVAGNIVSVTFQDLSDAPLPGPTPSPVPDSGSALALMGLALVGLVPAYRRQNSAP